MHVAYLADVNRGERRTARRPYKKVVYDKAAGLLASHTSIRLQNNCETKASKPVVAANVSKSMANPCTVSGCDCVIKTTLSNLEAFVRVMGSWSTIARHTVFHLLAFTHPTWFNLSVLNCYLLQLFKLHTFGHFFMFSLATAGDSVKGIDSPRLPGEN